MPLEESEFMKASDLIRAINSVNSELELIFEKDIQAIIQNAIKDPKCIREVNSKKDLNGLDKGIIVEGLQKLFELVRSDHICLGMVHFIKEPEEHLQALGAQTL